MSDRLWVGSRKGLFELRKGRIAKHDFAGQPVSAFLQTPPVPVPGAAPPPANFAIPPIPAVPTYTWSRLTWHGFLRSEQGL